MDASDLTPRQQSVMDFIRLHQRDEGMAPTVREICTCLGLKGPAGVHRILNVLIDKGYLLTTPGKKRSWRPANEIAGSTIPLLGSIAAGLPLEATENKEEDLPLDPRMFCRDENCFALRVQGDSMIGAHIMEGELAIIRSSAAARDGEIVAALIEDILPEATLKILRKKPNRTELEAANPAYPPLVFAGEEQERIHILGTLVGVIRRF